MKLSIIIPFYKTYDLTCVLLDNLCKQLTKDVEVILIDDGTNETRLDSYCDFLVKKRLLKNEDGDLGKFNIKILHLPENKGLSHARNQGIKKATGKYITFVDSDDDISKDYIDIILKKINSSDFDYCLFSWKFTGFKTEEVLIKDEAPEWNRCVWNCVYKRDKIGLFEEGIQIHEDSIFNLKYRKGKRENIEEVLYYYFFNRKDSISNRFAEGKTKVQEEWNKEVLLSIIIPYYKTYNLTIALLDELCSQYNSKMEIILIQDGCDDNFEKYLIKIIKKENGGVSSARNRGLDIAIGKYIAFIDSDDMIKDNYVSTIINKIESEDFDYCYLSWEATGRIKGQFIIKDNPPSWNTCVWNCIYKRELIGDIKFNENRQITEDTEFNDKVRKGKKANILDILYTYNSGRPDSLTDRYSKDGNQKQKIEAQIVIYRSYISMLGGVETAIYNLCEQLKDKYEILVVYDTCDHWQLLRLKKMVKCVNYNGQQIVCDKFIYYSLNPIYVEQTVEAGEIIQHICCDIEELKQPFVKSPKTTKLTADSEASARAYMRKFPKDRCMVLYNLFVEPIKARPLYLMSATRLSWEKGYNRMKVMAKRLNELKIPFTWEVFTNDIPDENIEGFIFREPRLNVADYMWNKDYGIQLSDSESWGCTTTEFLQRGTPCIVTDYPSAKEQITVGKNGFILNRDLSNLDEVIKNMQSNQLKGFKYQPKYSVKQWKDLLGEEKRSNYKYNPAEPLVIIDSNKYVANQRIKGDDNVVVETGQDVFIKDSVRLKLLLERKLITRKD